jgi:hypothetical protein
LLVSASDSVFSEPFALFFAASAAFSAIASLIASIVWLAD